MKKIKKYLLTFYLISLVIIGVLKVPATRKWGPNGTIDSMEYVPIWKVQDTSTIDGYVPFYQIDITRVFLEVIILTLIVYVLYLLFSLNKEQ
ncbi:MAG: hypothetical protein E7L01_26545 [Paenibacillus macerans]|uniref:Uncharacterized protein n=1 Tax=Paenibacillus macerans TaxID=44252 RepID=A0A6N8EY33_PAEMA|nr:hypothetical protein [Paenibacillus macerans]MBS5911776.1 hypothetical protein [Paenibacillus macerans]MCY7559049.1 hypothetical protein [Paenibacillus macerans]MDU7476873.1 hypothetical protein [Paenibacillus macerans]MEC0137701.1 hypothetical protein [Paenibacillus macerans]MEC0152709.1 hypothetical protein [Paenibacillus macerans]